MATNANAQANVQEEMFDAAAGVDEFLQEQAAKKEKPKNVRFVMEVPKDQLTYVHREGQYKNGKSFEYDAVLIPIDLISMDPNNPDRKKPVQQFVECETDPKKTVFLQDSLDKNSVYVTISGFPDLTRRVYEKPDDTRYKFRISQADLAASHKEAMELKAEASKVRLQVRTSQVDDGYEGNQVEVRLPAGIIQDHPHNEVLIYVPRDNARKRTSQNGSPYYDVVLSPPNAPDVGVHCFLAENPKVPESMGVDTEHPVMLRAAEIRDRYREIRQIERIQKEAASKPEQPFVSSYGVRPVKKVPAAMEEVAAAAQGADMGMDMDMDEDLTGPF